MSAVGRRWRPQRSGRRGERALRAPAPPTSSRCQPRRDGLLPAGLMGSAVGRLPAGLLLLLLLLTLLPPPAANRSLRNAPSRNRRGLLQLAGAIQCSTGRTPFAYMRYGCYCGLGGSGWPRDPADWCCFEHDCCYGKAEKAGCAPKIQTYTWECEDKRAKCEDIEDKCQKLACECDRRAAKCLSKAPYNAKLIFWPDTLCGTNSPQCEDD